MTSRLRGRHVSFESQNDEESAQAEDLPTPAQMNLTRLYEQNQQKQQKNMAAKANEQPPEAPAKGKPRLLLMGQRR